MSDDYKLCYIEGPWEIHPDGVGRRQFYRPLPKQQEGAP